MAIHWKIPFKSLRSGTVYTVNIYDDLFTGTPIELIPGESPFTTDELDDEDIFIPVRTQSGYLRFFDNGKDANGNDFNWKDIIPSKDTDRPVTLTHIENGQTIVDWQGFMQAQDFGSELYGNPQEREFPIQCVLSVLNNSELNPTLPSLWTFADFLNMILNDITGVTIGYLYFQGGNDAADWLQIIMNMQNMITEDYEGNFTAKYSYFQMVEEICKFFGWSARVHGQDVYFTSVDDTNIPTFLKTTINGLEDISVGDLSTSSIENFPLSTKTITDEFVSTNNEDSRLMGASTAVVSSNANEADPSLIPVWPYNVVETMETYQWSTVGTISAGRYISITQGVNSVTSGNVIATAVANKAQFGLLSEGERGLNGNIKSNIRILDTYNNANVFASIETKEHGVYGDGALELNAEIYLDSGRLSTRKFMWLYIGIGSSKNSAKWYDMDNFNWTTTKKPVLVTIGDDGKVLRVVEWVDSSHTSYWSYSLISIGTPLNGKVFVEFLGSENIGSIIMNICDFKINFYRGYANYSGNTGNVQNKLILRKVSADRDYKANNQNEKPNEWSTSCIFASDNMSPYGFGLLVEASGFRYVSSLNYGNLIARPEQHLANRVVNYWASAKRKLTIEVDSVLINVTPQNKVSIDNTTTYPIAISHDWRDDITKLVLLEI